MKDVTQKMALLPCTLGYYTGVLQLAAANLLLTGTLLQLLAQTSDVGAALELLGQDVHQHLTVQVCVLSMANHFLKNNMECNNYYSVTLTWNFTKLS